ncbi:cysteine permease [Sulfurospirillum sp. 1307]|jgi:hypothetical protein
MQMNTLSNNQFLDNFVLNKELCHKVGISSNAYRFWKSVKAAKYDGSRIVFLDKRTIIPKYHEVISTCKDLSGFVLASAFCKYTGIAPSHLIKSNNSSLYEKLDIFEIFGIKFVNLKEFYDDLGLDYGYQIYVEKCKYFGPSPLEKKIKLTQELCLGYY